MKEQEITIGKGVKPIILGMTISQIEKKIGKPDDFEELDYEDGTTGIIWYYDDLALDLNFESDEDFKLTHISFNSDIYILGGAIKVGMHKNEVLKLCEALNYEHDGIESIDLDDSSSDKDESINIDDKNITLWFSNDILDEIQIGPYWADDDTPIWPEID